MSTLACNREQDVLDAVAAGRWPGRCDAALRSHVAGCSICAEVAAVSMALRDDHEAAWRDARVPPSGRVWWRAEMRARRDAARRAAQPMALVHGAAAACAGGVFVALLALTWPTLRSGVGVLAVSSLSTILPQFGVPLAIAAGSIVLLVPIALYFVLSEK